MSNDELDAVKKGVVPSIEMPLKIQETMRPPIRAQIMDKKCNRKMFDDKKGYQSRGHHPWTQQIALGFNDKSLIFLYFVSTHFFSYFHPILCVDTFRLNFLIFSLEFQYHCMHSDPCFVWSCLRSVFSGYPYRQSVVTICDRSYMQLGILFTFCKSAAYIDH